MAWVADRLDAFSRGWRVLAKNVDARYRTGFTSRTVGVLPSFHNLVRWN